MGRTVQIFIDHQKKKPPLPQTDTGRSTQDPKIPAGCMSTTPGASKVGGQYRSVFFLTRDRSSTKCPSRVHRAGHGSVTGPTLGVG